MNYHFLFGVSLLVFAIYVVSRHQQRKDQAAVEEIKEIRAKLDYATSKEERDSTLDDLKKTIRDRYF